MLTFLLLGDNGYPIYLILIYDVLRAKVITNYQDAIAHIVSKKYSAPKNVDARRCLRLFVHPIRLGNIFLMKD